MGLIDWLVSIAVVLVVVWGFTTLTREDEDRRPPQDRPRKPPYAF